MKIKVLRQVIGHLARTGIGSVEVRDAQMGLRILMEPDFLRARAHGDCGHGALPRSGSVAGASSARVLADADGIFLLSHPLDSRPLSQQGALVDQGQVIALLKIGVLYRPVVARQAGIVNRIFAAHRESVRLGSPLIELTCL